MNLQHLKTYHLIILVIFIFSIINKDNNLKAQSLEEINSIKYIFEKYEKETYRIDFDQTNEFMLGINILFTGYKNFVSPYDMQSCTFHPSCSVYAMESIEKKGFFKGILNSIDRLTRCNGISPENYEKYNDILLFDPVE